MSKTDKIKELRERIDSDIESAGGIEGFNNYPCGNEVIASWIDRILDIIEAKDNKLDRTTLIDFFINSVDNEQKPIWTEEHIEELLDNFDVIARED